MQNYSFVTADNNTCCFTVCGEYADGTFDVAVSCAGYSREWEQVDGASADEMFADLLANGIRFESKRSLVANVYIVWECLLDGCGTVPAIIGRVEAMSDDEIDEKLDYWFDTTNVTMSAVEKARAEVAKAAAESAEAMANMTVELFRDRPGLWVVERHIGENVFRNEFSNREMAEKFADACKNGEWH